MLCSFMLNGQGVRGRINGSMVCLFYLVWEEKNFLILMVQHEILNVSLPFHVLCVWIRTMDRSYQRMWLQCSNTEKTFCKLLGSSMVHLNSGWYLCVSPVFAWEIFKFWLGKFAKFVGNYVIVIAFMSMISTSNTPELQDYIQPVAVTPDSGKPNEKRKEFIYLVLFIIWYGFVYYSMLDFVLELETQTKTMYCLY